MKKKGISKYVLNTSWLLGSKIYRMGLALVVTVWMARYLGPEQFGVFSYALSFVSLFSVLISLGLENIIVREVLNHPDEDSTIITSGLMLRCIGGILFISSTMLIIISSKPGDVLTQTLVLIFSIGYLFKIFDVLRYWFEAHIKAKFSAGMEIVAFTISVSLKIVLIVFKAPLIYFAWAVSVEAMVMAVGLLFLWFNRKTSLLNHFKPNWIKARYLIKEAWPLILAGALYTIYSKIDQIMLGEMIGNQSVGVYAAAVRLSEGWFFIPTVIASSLYPTMINAKNLSRDLYLERTQHLLNLMAVIGVGAAILIGVLAFPIIDLIFGSEYKTSAMILVVHIWGGVFLAISGISYRYLVAEGLQKYSFYRGLTGLIVNIAMNLWLIPLYGIMGAAIATVASQFMALYFFNVSNPRTRELFFMQSKALSLVEFGSTVKFFKSAIFKV